MRGRPEWKHNVRSEQSSEINRVDLLPSTIQSSSVDGGDILKGPSSGK